MNKYKKYELNIRKIKRHFEKLNKLYNSLNEDQKNEINRYHEDNFQLGYCIKWGLNASQGIFDYYISRNKWGEIS